jgi:hypothetical protein
MQVTYKFSVDAAYYRTLIERYYRQRPLLFHLRVQFGILALIVSGVFVVGIDSPLEIKGPVALVLGALAFFGGIAATRWGIFQRFRYRADFGTDVTVTMSADGLVGSGRHVEGKWAWAAYPRAVRYPDGIMLLRAGVIRWLPDSALTVGNPVDATTLARSNSALRDLA